MRIVLMPSEEYLVISNQIQIMIEQANAKKQAFQKRIVFSSQISNKENPVDHLLTETPLIEQKKNQSRITEQLKSPTLAQESSKQDYDKIIDKSQSESVELLSKKSYSSFGVTEQLKKFSKRKSSKTLKDTFTRMRVGKIRDNFITKIHLNNVYSLPISETDIWAIQNCRQQDQGSIRNQTLLKVWGLCYMIAIVGAFFSLSFSISFRQLRKNSLIDFFVIYGIIATSVQLVMNFSKIMSLLQRNSMRSLQAKPIILLQTTTQFILLLSLIFFFSDYHFAYRQIALLFCLTKMHKISSYSSFIRQKYNKYCKYSKLSQFFKLLLSNLFFAHAIAILLNYMISSRQSNWQVDESIDKNTWPQRYIWSYYWAAISIAKIGVPFTPKSAAEAVWLVILQVLSFAILLYNISQIVQILGIRKSLSNPHRRVKMLEQMADNEHFSQQLKFKISQVAQLDYIQNCQETGQQNDILNSLPIELQHQISRQTNIDLLYRTLSFLLKQPTIQQLAIKLKKYKYYPSQTIRRYNDPHNIYILQNGTVSYVSKEERWRTKIEGNIITKNQEAFLLNWDFITMESMPFDIKAKTISTIGKINFEDFINCLKLKSYDFEFYCFIRDKSKHILDQFSTVCCRYCLCKHTAFTCHKMHYIPLKQHKIYRYIEKLKKSKQNSRADIDRISMRKTPTLRSLTIYKYHYSIEQRYDRGNTIQDKLVRQQPYYYQNNHDQHYANDLQKTIRMLNQTVFPSFEKYEDSMWGLATDACQNYRNYFPQCNVINLTRNIFIKQIVK